MGHFSEGLAAVMKRGVNGSEKWGFINKAGKIVLPLEYDDAGTLSGGLCWVRKGLTYGVFENPYYIPEKESGDALSDVVGQVTGNKNDSTDKGDRADDAPERSGSFPVVPVVVIAVVAIAAIAAVAVAVLVLKAKKPALEKVTAPRSAPQAAPAEQTPPATGPKFCPNCGNPVTPGVKFCPECGQPLQGGKG